MKTLIVVCAWGGGQRIFDLNSGFWESHGCDILVCCPEDSPVRTRFNLFVSGRSVHCGPLAVPRWKAITREVVLRGYDASVWFEYDSFCLKPDLGVITNGLHCTIGVSGEPHRFSSRRYAGFPWTFTAESLGKVMTVAENYPDITEEGYHDRLMGAWCELAGVPMTPHNPPGYAPNTILPEHYPDVFKSAQAGCCWWHGIKDIATRDFITQSYKPR